MGMYGLGVVVAPAVGPTLGGYLVEYVDWRLIFYINVPIGIVGVVAGAGGAAPRSPDHARPKFDLLGLPHHRLPACSRCCSRCSEGAGLGLDRLPGPHPVRLGVLSLALFVIIELEVDNPLMDLRVFRYWPFTNSLLLITICRSACSPAVLRPAPVPAAGPRACGAFDAGLLLLPQALVMAVCMPVAGRVYDRFGPRWPGRDRAVDRRVGHLRAARADPRDLARAPRSGSSPCARPAWASP